MWAALVLVPTMTYALLNLGIESSNVYLTGSRKYPPDQIIYFLLPGILLFSPVRVLSTYFMGTGKPAVNTFVNSVTLIVNIALNLLVIPRMGVKGAAMASAISYSPTYLIYLFLYKNESGLSPLEFFLFRREDFKKI